MSEIVEPVERKVDPSGFRKRVREDVAADYEKIRGVLLRAMDAEKEVRVRCPNCNDARAKAVVPDFTAANKAAELYMNAGFGRVESESKESPECPSCAEVKAMSDEDIVEGMVRHLTARGFRVERESAASDV